MSTQRGEKSRFRSSQLIGSIRGTDRSPVNAGNAVERIPEGTKNPLKKALAILADEKIVTAADIEKIVSIRNDVGHAMHKLLEEITKRPKSLADALAHSQTRYAYDYYALTRIEGLVARIKAGMSTHYILPLNEGAIHYELAEATY